MTETITVTFAPTYADAKEASAAAAPLMQTRRMVIANWILGAASSVLTMIGTITAMLFFLGDVVNITYLYVIIGAAVLILGLYYASGYSERAAYAEFQKTDFGQSNTFEIDAKGFTLRTSQSCWATGWGDVKDVFQTENTIGFVTPVVPMFFPTATIEDPKAAFAQIRTWHKAQVNA